MPTREAEEEAARTAADMDRDVKYIIGLGEREERLWKMQEAASIAERKRGADERRMCGMSGGNCQGTGTKITSPVGLRRLL